MKKVIMLLSNPCIKDPRVEFEADILSHNGFNVEILAWDRNNENADSEIRNKYKITRFYIKSNFNQGLRQVFKFFLFYSAVTKYLFKKNKFDIIHCHDLDTLLIGVFFKIFKRKKLVYDSHEIYSDMAFQNLLLNRLTNMFEKLLVRLADLFITVGEIRKEWYFKKRYPEAPVIIGNWKSKKKLKPGINKIRNKLNMENKILILYIGSLNKERMILELINAVKNDKRFVFYIAGEGAEKNKILNEISKLKNIKYLGFLKKDDDIDYYNSICDVIYYGINPEYPVSKTATPNKMFEAISFDKIFFSSKTGEIEKINNINNAFIFIHNIKKDLNKIYRLKFNRKLRLELSKKNNFLYNIYNADSAKKILIEEYSKLQ